MHRALEALLAQTSKQLFKASNGLQERYADLMETLRSSDQIPTSALQKMLEIKGVSAHSQLECLAVRG